MIYENVLPAVFLNRPNRFIAHVELKGRTEVCHVKNTGRCRELLVPGCRVYVQYQPSPARKTAYDLIAVEKGNRLINMDANAPNRVFGEYVRAGRFLREWPVIRPGNRPRGFPVRFLSGSAGQAAFRGGQGCNAGRGRRDALPGTRPRSGA